MDPGLEQLIRAIHASPYQAVVYVTGGCAQGASWLLAVPGASSTVLEVNVPYSRNSLVELLGQEPSQYCSPETALDLAKAAFQRAAALSSFGAPIMGLGATAALASEPPKRGDHRVYIAAHTCNGTHCQGLKLAKGARSRQEEEELVSRLLLQVLARACQVPSADSFSLPLLPAQDGHPADELAAPQDTQAAATSRSGAAVDPEPLQALLSGAVRCVEYSGGNVYVDAPRRHRVYLPGSFNPLHEGHRAMLDAAVGLAGPDAEGCFELTVRNADKGMLALSDIQRRVQQFVDAGLPLLVTTACLLLDKARLLPNSTFVVGWDTAVRVVMPKYYGGSTEAMDLVLAEIGWQGCSFLVAGRTDDKGGGGFKTLADIQLPPAAAAGQLFRPIPESSFRSELSSTALRAAGKGLA